jgi:hypothetical protein
MFAEIFLITIVIIARSETTEQNNGHSLITPFEGTYIENQEVKEFDEQHLVIGKVQSNMYDMLEMVK